MARTHKILASFADGSGGEGAMGFLTLVSIHIYNKQISLELLCFHDMYRFTVFMLFTVTLRPRGLFAFWYYDGDTGGTQAFHESRLG